MRRAIAMTAALLLAAEARAQTAPALVPGMRLRLSGIGLCRGRLVGTLSAAEDGTLAVITEDQLLVRVPRATVSRLEVSRGRHRNEKKGFLLGAAAALSTLALCLPDKNYHPNCTFDDTAGPLATMTLTGGLMGAAIGHFIRTDQWVDVPPDRIQVDVRPGLAPEPGTRSHGPGAALGLSLSLSF